MTNREKYSLLCERESLPLHAQAWWWERASKQHEWDVLFLEDESGEPLAAMPYQTVRRLGLRAMLMPVHTQYEWVWIRPEAPADIYARLAQALEDLCRAQRIVWVQLQGFLPLPLIEALAARGFCARERVTYRIDTIPSRSELPSLFSENKRRQLRKAKDLRLTDLTPQAFYAFHRTCLAAQGKRIDYREDWADAVLTEAVKRGSGRLLAAQDKEGNNLAALFLAWDDRTAYYLMPTYAPAAKDSGAVAWLTAEALEIARDKGLAFDFEGSMTPSIASSYRQFGGKAVVYHRIEKYYHFLIRCYARLRS